MTREHKLALIFGFALVLVVGLLISDNFSASRKSEPGGPQTAEAQPPMFKDDVLVADGNTAKPEISPVPATAPGMAPGTITDPAAGTQFASNDLGTPGVSPVTMGTKDPSTFGGRLGEAWNETIQGLGNGHTTLPEAAGTEPVGQPLTNPANDPRVTLQTPSTSGSMFDPNSKPSTLDGNGLDGAGSDTRALGVPRESGSGKTDPKPITESKPEPTTSKDATHRIAEGDSFWKIAKQHYNDPSLADALKTYNKARIGKNGQLRTGASLLIPEKSVLKGGTATASTKSPETKKSDLKVPSKADLEKLDKTAKAETKPETTKKSGTTTYVVKEGDTLGKIAKKLLGSSKRWTDILEANSSTLDSEDDVQAGQTLKIPAR